MNDGAIGFFDAFPAVVAVHGVVTSADARDAADAELAHFLFELAKKIYAAFGRSVAPVHEAVDENILDFIFARHLQQGEEMIDVRMHAAVAEEAHQMQLPSAPALHGFEKQGLAREFAAGDELIDARAVHLHDAAGADIQMAHFAIAHLPVRQADGRAGSVDQRVGEFFEDAIVVGLAREGDGVALGFGAVAPAVQDGENNRFGPFCGHVRGCLRN